LASVVEVDQKNDLMKILMYQVAQKDNQLKIYKYPVAQKNDLIKILVLVLVLVLVHQVAQGWHQMSHRLVTFVLNCKVAS
jgi:hypothetical protein